MVKKICKDMSIYIYFVTVVLFLAVSRSDNGRNFKRNTNATVQIISLSPGWTDVSPVSCVARCAREFPSCRSVQFNNVTKHCTPGSWPIPSKSTRDTSQVTLYSDSMICNEQASAFTYQVNDGTMCAWRSGGKLNYTSARRNCIENHGRLYTIQTYYKLQRLQHHFYGENHQYWIGLDDINKEGEFVWADGTALPSFWSYEVFHQGQPDDFLGIEDCVIYNSSFGPLNDVPCKDEWPFICESEAAPQMSIK